MPEPDATESAVRRLAARKNGTPKTVDDVFELVLAVDQDANVRHELTATAVRALGEDFADHCTEAVARDLRLDGLENWQRHSTETCTERVTALVRPLIEEADKRHDHKHAEHVAADHLPAPRRSTDPPAADFAEKRTEPETPAEADTSRARFTREQIVANFWILVGLLALSGIVNGLIDLLFRR